MHARISYSGDLKTLQLAGLRTSLLISMQVIVDFLKQRTVSIRI
jgi:hypothetical protein